MRCSRWAGSIGGICEAASDGCYLTHRLAKIVALTLFKFRPVYALSMRQNLNRSVSAGHH